MTDLRRRHVDTPIGQLTIVASDRGLTNIFFAGEDPAASGLPASLPFDDDDATLAATAAQLTEYFAGERTRFDVPLDLDGTEFQKQAWLALAEVPYGTTSSYGEQAAAIGRAGAARAVGAANGRNPVPIVLPCHRIVGADGSLTGFGGGLETKARLLQLEQRQQPLPGI